MTHLFDASCEEGLIADISECLGKLYKGVNELKAVFISHLDNDHISAILEKLGKDDEIMIKQDMLTGNSLATSKGQELYKALTKNFFNNL